MILLGHQASSHCIYAFHWYKTLQVVIFRLFSLWDLNGCQIQAFLNLALDGDRWSASHSSCCHWRKRSWHSLYRRLGSPRPVLDVLAERNIPALFGNSVLVASYFIDCTILPLQVIIYVFLNNVMLIMFIF
jgi:hypothetical protein